MFAAIKQLSGVGAAVVGVGLVSVFGPGVAYAQPPLVPQGVDISCPAVDGINYLPDPDDSNAYYLCVDGLLQNHYQCPRITKLIMSTPPRCSSLSPHMP